MKAYTQFQYTIPTTFSTSM